MFVVNIFICYKKIRERMRDGKIVEQEDTKAEIFHHLLSNAGGEYAPWMDDAELNAGMEWEAEIYGRILISDVIVVLVGVGTSKSEWVKREIALGNALGISIVPVGFDLEPDEMVAELKGLGIDHLQFKITRNIKLNAGEALLSELGPDLTKAATRTKKQQEETLRGLLNRRDVRPPKAPDNQRAATFNLKIKDATTRLHVASGDISKVNGIDALVNSENDYMQMARFFESKTVSSLLRRLGASIQNGKYNDTIQRELDFQLQDRGRPVQAGEVFVTSSGGLDSELARLTKTRYIFHVAAVEAVVSDAKVIPYKQPDQIESCVRNSLYKIAEINQLNGVVSPPGSKQRAEQEKRASLGDSAIRSILFPLFGTGQGGSSIAEVVGAMLASIQRFFQDTEEEGVRKTLGDLYISAFTKDDVQKVIGFLREQSWLEEVS